MKLIVKTAPTSEPITLAEAKAHLRITHALEDDYINSLIKVAREKFEKDTERTLMETEFEMYLDELSYNYQFDCDVVVFKCPVKSIDEIAVLSTEGATGYTVVNSGTYSTDVKGEPARVQFLLSPSYYAQMNAIRVTFKAGYETVPEQAKQAVKLLIGHFYENRQTVVTGTQVNEVPQTYQYLMEQFKYTL